MEKRSYEIMSGDVVTAVWENDTLTVKNPSLLPLYLRRVANADLWLETRAIDSHRPNSRLLKKALRLAERDDISTVIHVNGATVTDNYWVRPIGSDMTYDDVRFSDDYFSALALNGTYDSFNRVASSGRSKTPELTNIGSFEKCWKLRNGKWWMYKRASHDEMFSELFVYELGISLGMSMAEYERGDGYIKSLDFTDGATVNFEPASAFMGDNEEYTDVVTALQRLCPQAIHDYIRMIFLDTICANPDRHTNNFGLLRDTATGDFIGFAPNFDNNMALISRGYPSAAKANDVLVMLFNELLDEYPEYRKLIPEVTGELVRETISKVGMRVRTRDVVDIIMSRYRAIQD